LANTLRNNWFVYVRNSGSGALTVQTQGGDELDGSASITLNPEQGAHIVCDGDNFYTISKSTSASSSGGSSFSRISINVAGSGDYTLSAAEQGYTAYNFTGAITGNRNIIVPTTLKEYWVTNGTTGSFTFTVKTAAGTGVAIGTGEARIVYCDGTNVVNAATAGISVPVQVSQGGTGSVTATGALANLGATSVGSSVFTAATQGSALGSGSVGDTMFTSATTDAAQTALGAGATGKEVFKAATQTAGRNALGFQPIGHAVASAIDVAGALTALGITAPWHSPLQAATMDAALTAMSGGIVGKQVFAANTGNDGMIALGMTATGRGIVLAADAAAARSQLALGTIATQNANTVSLNGSFTGSFNGSYLGSNITLNGGGGQAAYFSSNYGAGIGPTMNVETIHAEGYALLLNGANAVYSADNGLLILQSERGASSTYDFMRARTDGGGANVFRIEGTGKIYSDVGSVTNPADYAEFFEWLDGNPANEDRVGYSVIIEEGTGKIRKATPEDPADKIVGIVSAVPAIVGDAAWGHWEGMYVKDVWGRVVMETVTYVSWLAHDGDDIVERPNGKKMKKPRFKRVGFFREDGPDRQPPAGADVTETQIERRKVNPAYDPKKPYENRKGRKEWSEVGTMGKLLMRKGCPVRPNWVFMNEVSDGIERWWVR
jgi:hypothetical protein